MLKTLLSVFMSFLIVAPQALAQESVSVDDSVEEDISFDTLPEEGIDIIDELPVGEASPDKIYDQKGKKRQRAYDVRDKGPIELKQAPDTPVPQKVEKPRILKEDPLFSVEKEEPISRPKADASQPGEGASETYSAPKDGFEMPANPLPDGSPGAAPTPTQVDRLRPGKSGTTPSTFGEPVRDQFGKPVSTPTPALPTTPEDTQPAKQYSDEDAPQNPESLDEEIDYESLEGEEPMSSRRIAQPTSPSDPSPGAYDDVEVIWGNRGSSEIKIKHPHSEQGLIRITQDRTYVYRVPRTQQDRAMSVRFGMLNPEDLENPETGATFTDSYDSTEAPVVFFEYEWQWFQTAIGKLGLKVGSGLFVAEGNGNFRNNYPENGGKTDPLEKFTFVAFPNSLAAVYRMQFYDKQVLIPYADGGVMGITFAEFRDDEDAPKLGIGYAGFFSIGGALNLGLMDSLSLLELDREYGINGLYLTGELRQIVNTGSDYDFTSSTVNAGILAEF